MSVNVNVNFAVFQILTLYDVGPPPIRVFGVWRVGPVRMRVGCRGDDSEVLWLEVVGVIAWGRGC